MPDPNATVTENVWEPVVIGDCRHCHWRALVQGGLCVDCREIREWTRVNKLVCDGVHRGVWPAGDPGVQIVIDPHGQPYVTRNGAWVDER